MNSSNMTMKEARKIAETVLTCGSGDGDRAYAEGDLIAALHKLGASTAADAPSLTWKLEQYLEARGVEL